MCLSKTSTSGYFFTKSCLKMKQIKFHNKTVAEVYFYFNKEKVKIPESFSDEEKITETLKDALKIICPKLPSREKLEIHVFPTLSSFVKNKMRGVSGFTPSSNAIHLYIHKNLKGNRSDLQEIKNSVAHEYNHAIRFQNFPLNQFLSLRDTLINEGLAENFWMSVFNKKTSPWAKSLSYKESKKVFEEIKPLLNSTDEKLYKEVFFGSKKYPLWSGYAIGYQVVKSFLKKEENLNWIEIIKLPSEEILKRSGWMDSISK